MIRLEVCRIMQTSMSVEERLNYIQKRIEIILILELITEILR